MRRACADPESFVQRDGPNLITFFSLFSLVDEGIEDSKNGYKWAIVGPPAIRTSIAKLPYLL